MIMAGAVATTPDWYVAKRRIDALRAASIEEFRDRQAIQRNWISLREQAYFIGAAKPPTRGADNLDNSLDILLWLTDLAARRCLPVMFLVDAGYPITRSWLENPEKAPPKAYVTDEKLKTAIVLHGRSVVAKQITANCYIPRADAIKLLQAADVKMMPDWAAVAALPSSNEPTAISFRQSEVPKKQYKIAPRGAYKAYAVDFERSNGHYSRRVDDEEWRIKMGFTRKSVMTRRRQYKATLSPDEQSVFGRPGAKRR